MTRPRKYDEAQKQHLRDLRELHAEFMNEKATLRQRIEEEFRAKLIDYEYRESRAMNKGLRMVNAAGRPIAKTDLGRAIGTTSWTTINARFDLTADEFSSLAPNYEWRWDGGKILLTKFREHDVSFHFELVDGDVYGDPEESASVTPEFLAEIEGDGSADWALFRAEALKELS